MSASGPPREVKVSPEVTALLPEPQLRHAVDAAGQAERCQLSGRSLAPQDAVALVVLREESSKRIEIAYADARTYPSRVIDAPGLAERAARRASEGGLDLTWCLLDWASMSVLAFQTAARFYSGDPDGGALKDPVRAMFEQRGWTAPAAGRLWVDDQARLTARAGALVLALPPSEEALAFSITPPAAWLDLARSVGRVVVLYGCGDGERIREALTLGDLVGAEVPFSQ